MEEIKYKKVGAYYLPDFEEEPDIKIGRYGQMRKEYLKEERQSLFTQLSLSCSLKEHLQEINQEAEEMYRRQVQVMKEKRGITEELKMRDPVKWTRAMNNIKMEAENIVLTQLVYS